MSYFSKNKLSNPIGLHDECEEFQVGTTIVWVYVNNSLGKEGSIKKANVQFDVFWNDKSKAVVFSESESRKLVPNLWKIHDDLNISVHPFSVWGIWYYPDIDEAHYDVNVNQDYPCGEGIPEFEEGSIIVVRGSKGALRISRAIT